MGVLIVVSLIGLLVDARTLGGESVWTKPLKFGISFAAYGLTLAWLLSKLVKGRRVGWWFGTVFAVSGFLDVVVIAAAAAAGTFSHFNTSDDVLNTVVQTTFQYFVPLLFLANVAIGIVVLLQRAGDRGVRAALATGLPIASAGMLVVFVLFGYTPQDHTGVNSAQEPVPLKGSHSVGTDVSGGDGMAITGWNLAGGDMRVPHFIGLHGIHLLLLLAVGLSAMAARRAWLRDERVRARLVGIVAAGYTGVFLITTWQALRGQSVADPDLATVTALLVVLAGTGAAATTVVRRALGHPTPARPPREPAAGGPLGNASAALPQR
ncbi:hypothetical protein AB8O38_07100 [Saccharomonospora xinjiangensis]|uniref:hypothetical protein n=1 Tax=Saccharomonospora xinjiangensis TaxID=75294 RepID=UPI00350F33D3